SQCRHEGTGPSGLLGRKEDEGCPLSPDQSSRTGYGACPGIDRQARRGSSVVRRADERPPENHGTWLCGIGVKTQKQIDANGCLEERKGGVRPKLALRRA